MERFINIKTNNGVKKMKLLYAINVEKTKRDFIIYTNDEKDEKGNLISYLAAYKLNNNEEYSDLDTNITKYEFDVINKIIKDGDL